MSQRDLLGLILSYIYAFGLLLIVEAIGRRLRWPHDLTRKIIHIGAGLWIWGILALFEHWTYGIIPFATFIVLNYVFYRRRLFQAMDAADATPGTVYFAFSITVLFALFWRTGGALDRVPIAAAAVMAMTLGDALASIVGTRWGRHIYTLFGHPRSWEGSITMAVVSFVAIYLALRLLPGSALSPNSIPLAPGMALWHALLGSVIAAAAEGTSPAGTDNLTVPLLTGAALHVLDLFR
jgi:phytol kinase